MSELTNVIDQGPWKLDPATQKQIDDYERYIQAEGPHSKLGKFYRREVARLKRFEPVFPSEAQPFVRPYTEKSFPGSVPVEVPEDERTNAGRTKDGA